MKRGSILIALGALIALTPYLGLPYGWLMAILPVLGLSVLALGILLRRRTRVQEPAAPLEPYEAHPRV